MSDFQFQHPYVEIRFGVASKMTEIVHKKINLFVFLRINSSCIFFPCKFYASILRAQQSFACPTVVILGTEESNEKQRESHPLLNFRQPCRPSLFFYIFTIYTLHHFFYTLYFNIIIYERRRYVLCELRQFLVKFKEI